MALPKTFIKYKYYFGQINVIMRLVAPFENAKQSSNLSNPNNFFRPTTYSPVRISTRIPFSSHLESPTILFSLAFKPFRPPFFAVEKCKIHCFYAPPNFFKLCNVGFTVFCVFFF